MLKVDGLSQAADKEDEAPCLSPAAHSSVNTGLKCTLPV